MRTKTGRGIAYLAYTESWLKGIARKLEENNEWLPEYQRAVNESFILIALYPKRHQSSNEFRTYRNRIRALSRTILNYNK